MLSNYLLYIITSAIINGTRGMDIISRATFIIFHFLLSYTLLGQDWKLSLIISAGIWGWLSKGWGVYFLAFNPSAMVFVERYDRSVKFIHKICDKIFRINNNILPDERTRRNWGTLGMSLRGFFFSIPLFIMLAIYTKNPCITLLSIPMLLQGFIYRFIGELYTFRKAEFLTAGLLASLILLSQIYLAS